MDNKDKNNGMWYSVKSMFNNLFSIGNSGGQEQLAAFVGDDEILSPPKQIFRNFRANKFGMLGLISFILIFVTVFGISAVTNYDKNLYEPMLANSAPGLNYLNYPKELQENGVLKIDSGASYSVAIDDQGKLYFWGQNPSYKYNVQEIKELTEGKKIKDVASGTSHIIALTEDNKIIGSGSNNFKQNKLNFENAEYDLEKEITGKNYTKVGAGQDFSVLLTEDGYIYTWGSVLNNNIDVIPAEYQGNIKDFAVGPYSILVTLNDGSIGVIGTKSNAIGSSIPAELQDGTVNVEKVVISKNTALAVDDKGKLYIWGSSENDLQPVSDEIMNGTYTDIARTQSSFLALNTEGKVVSWGKNLYGVATVPSNVEDKDIDTLYADTFQIYAVDSENNIEAWGNKGFLLGTDSLGRDIALRLIEGGKISLTIGAVAVLISTIIGLFVGLIAGYFGGKIDNILMRAAEIVNSFPFLPLAITLSALLPSETPEDTRIMMIMVILGVLSWPSVARLVRGQILAEREKEFILASKALGLKESTILIKHILPSVFNIIIVSMTLGYASSLLTEAGLSFLGFGVQPPMPSWGNMLTGVANTTVIEYYWWQWALPAMCVMLTALSVNLIGDALRDAMDPRSNKNR